MTDGVQCGAKKRQGEGTCALPAGWGTDHVGYGRCKLHGGVVGKQLKHGLYAKQYRHSRRIGDLINEIEESGTDPLDMRQDVLAARALFLDYLRGTDEQSFDASVATQLVDRITVIVKRIEDVASQNAVSYRDFRRIMQAMGSAVNDVVQDPALRQAIKERWGAVRLA